LEFFVVNADDYFSEIMEFLKSFREKFDDWTKNPTSMEQCLEYSKKIRGYFKSRSSCWVSVRFAGFKRINECFHWSFPLRPTFVIKWIWQHRNLFVDQNIWFELNEGISRRNYKICHISEEFLKFKLVFIKNNCTFSNPIIFVLGVLDKKKCWVTVSAELGRIGLVFRLIRPF
jgi:hypothetical protein